MPSDTEKIKEQQNIADVNLRELLEACMKFAAEIITDARLRKEYIELAKKTADEILQSARKAAIATPGNALEIWRDAAKRANELRNIYLEQTRKNISKVASAFSEWMKENIRTYSELIQIYTKKLFATTETESVNFSELSNAEQQKVYETIVEASGRTNPTVNAISKWSGRIAIVLILVTIGISIYNMCQAANPTLEAVKTAVSLGFAQAGGKIGAELGAAIGACGGPAGVLIGCIVGGITGGFLTAFGGESLVNVLYRAFFPSSVPGPGPPPFDVIPVLYGQPYIGCVPVVGKPKIRGAPTLGPPALRENAVVGLPKLWHN